MIKLVKYTHIPALVILLGAVWFDKDIPLSIVLLASVGPIIDLVGNLLADRVSRSKMDDRASQLENEVKELREKVSGILLSQQMGRM